MAGDLAHDVADLIRAGAIADHIAKTDVLVDPLLVERAQNCRQCFEVRVDVGEDADPHYSDRMIPELGVIWAPSITASHLSDDRSVRFAAAATSQV